MLLRRSVPIVMSYLWAGVAAAHHSFAAYYGPTEPEGLLTLTGIVTEFRYTNPHGVLQIEVRDDHGATERWTVETLAPAMLSKTGWSRDSLRPGEQVTVQGWRARDGSKLMRLQTVTRANGTTLGAPAPARAAQK